MTFLVLNRQSYHCSVKTKQSAPFHGAGGLDAVRANIIDCNRCPRLRTYCRAVAAEKRAAFRHWQYWGRPVPGFGDPNARIFILGLAPAAHGANRTGRVFTGDGAGGSGDFLIGALHRAGLANIATSSQPDDGLQLRDVYIASAVRCAPPGNQPTPDEVAQFLGAPGGNFRRADVEGEEVIDEAVPLPAVVAEPLVEPFLLEHDAIVNARRLPIT